jgi:hypothetical protein
MIFATEIKENITSQTCSFFCYPIPLCITMQYVCNKLQYSPSCQCWPMIRYQQFSRLFLFYLPCIRYPLSNWVHSTVSSPHILIVYMIYQCSLYQKHTPTFHCQLLQYHPFVTSFPFTFHLLYSVHHLQCVDRGYVLDSQVVSPSGCHAGFVSMQPCTYLVLYPSLPETYSYHIMQDIVNDRASTLMYVSVRLPFSHRTSKSM